ncbi:MAG: hypothetical protein WBP46_01995 [Thiolinea sp.]
MPKLIIKREVPKRFTRQAILFWVLGLLPVALLAGFLTGNLISQLRHTSLEAGATPMQPLAPLKFSAPELPKSQTPTLPLPAASELTNDTLNTQPELPTKQDSATQAATPEHSKLVNPPQPPAKTNQISKKTAPQTKAEPAVKTPQAQALRANKPAPSINRANTNDQPNNRNHPARTPSTAHKPVKSPQTVSESSRPAPRPVASTQTAVSTKAAASSAKPVKARTSASQSERGTNDDYRLLEQSLGIPLQ